MKKLIMIACLLLASALVLTEVAPVSAANAGTVDPTFNQGGVIAMGVEVMFAFALQPDGKVIVGGSFGSYNGYVFASHNVLRLNADGSHDTTFNPGGAGTNGGVRELALQPDGKVLVAGDFTSYNGDAAAPDHVIRLNADGTRDATFNPGGAGANSLLRALALQPDGKILVGGSFTSYNGDAAAPDTVMRLNADGSRDTTFGTTGASAPNVCIGCIPSVGALTVQPDGKIVVGGFFTTYDGDAAAPDRLMRLNADGTRDTAFNPGGAGSDSSVSSFALQPDGKILVGGSFTSYNGDAAAPDGVLRLNADGTRDTAFNPGGTGANNSVEALALQPDGKILVGGSFTSYNNNGSAPHLLLRLLGESNAVDQTITVTAHAPADAAFGTSFTVAATASSGLPVSYGSAGACTNTGATFTMTSATGACTVRYDQAGSANYKRATQVTETVAAKKADQTITFGSLPDRAFGNADFNVSAAASSGLAVSFAPTGQCTVSGTTVRLTGSGTCTVTASQAGSSNYNAAADVPQTFQIAKASTTTALSTSTNPSAVGQSVTFTAAVASAAGTPTGTVQFKVDGANAGAPAALNAGGVATFTTSGLSVGARAVTAEYGGDSNFSPSAGTLTGGQTVGSLIEFSQSAYSVAEGGALLVTVRRTGETGAAASVDYATDDGGDPSVPVPCSSTTGLALDRCDFTRALGTLRFAVGETQKTFSLLVGDDSYAEGPEALTLRLSNPAGGGALGAVASAAVTINDDSPESAGNPIDDATKFVTQHYRDFLNRDPDADGLAFWAGGIAGCGSNVQCREVKRIDTSAAFFLSIEFQETGFLVYRMFKAAYGDATSPGVAGTVPAVRFDEFLADTQRIGRGVVVHQGPWEQQLEANKQAYALEFVQRQRFLAAFPASMTAAEFVSKLDENAGGVLAADERAQLAAALAAAPSDAVKRAAAVRQVAEHAALRQREFNRAFVLMQYFGYLRRNPDDAPEQSLNFGGWRFWLTKLEEFGGDYRRAEMVKAFLEAIEYRRRFGQQ